MNVFEFLLVIVSILLGLGIAELLAGMARMLRGELVAGTLHSLWMFIVFQLQVQLAWGLWDLSSCRSRAMDSLPVCSAGCFSTRA